MLPLEVRLASSLATLRFEGAFPIGDASPSMGEPWALAAATDEVAGSFSCWFHVLVAFLLALVLESFCVSSSHRRLLTLHCHHPMLPLDFGLPIDVMPPLKPVQNLEGN